MRSIYHSFRVLYSELVQRSLDAAFSVDFSLEGRFVTAESRSRRYWYFDRSDGEGGKRHRYVGPVDDLDITSRVESFKEAQGGRSGTAQARVDTRPGSGSAEA